MHARTFAPLTFYSYLTFHSRNQVNLLNPRTSSGSKSGRFPHYHCQPLWLPLQVPTAIPTRRICPHIPLHSPRRPSCRRQGHSSCPTYSQNRGRGRCDGQHPRYVRSPLAFSSLLILSSPARTSIPVPRVYLYCSMPDNPVPAEWVLMDYVPGQRLMDCWDDMGVPQKPRTAKDLARVMAEMFALTASYCGTLLCGRSLSDSQRSPCY